MSYLKEVEIKIIRTKHKITFKVGTSIETLNEYLKNIPQYAEVDEFYDDSSNPDGVCSIIFHHEKAEDKP